MHSDAAGRFAVRTCFVLSALKLHEGMAQEVRGNGHQPSCAPPILVPRRSQRVSPPVDRPHTAVALPLYNSQRQIQLCSLLIVHKYTTFFRTELKCLPFFVCGGENSNAYVCF